MTVEILRKSIEETGTATTASGEETVWKVQFELRYQGTNTFSFQLNFDIVGPAGASQAEEAAYEELQIFLHEASSEAASRAGTRK